ncbi:acyl-[ACP]--phospholipid O-acyltransferase [Campylobacter corcagiensis]|uniref:MFS transporter n=1 Tax=Campylobacter corcagiensis TaxID=1448857 RepID=A0A7M1LI98_9BACT|nr:acyl-[ACP]--phospholipid O-acyltransferase [Campylobacter corcagiensis]QKF64111.1 2-acylglycerophosphoethanolamine acyltransferase / acyl-acyl carrier protein synthetase [Campylobacter corcagiensis]QOQ87694.1 MFS transporter [Campylobacter corcagiensis]
MKELFKLRGFLVFTTIVLLNASIDLGHKITIQNTLVKSFTGDTLVTLTALVNLLILLPYVACFSLSGFINDKFSRTLVSRYAAASEIIFTAFITIAYFNGWFYFAFAMTILLAIQSAIYSPAKYSLIKQIVGEKNLGPANGVIEAVTIIAILASSLVFSIVFENFAVVSDNPGEIMKSVWFIGLILFITSSTETFLAYRLPYFKPTNKEAKFKPVKYITFGYLRENLSLIFKDKNIWLAVLGLSIFWALSQLIIAVFPAHYKFMSTDDNVIIIQLILAISALGLVFGSVFAGHCSKNHIELGLVPLGAALLFASLFMFANAHSLLMLVVCSISFGFAGGIFIVPLNANIQLFSKDDHMGRTIAASNFIQNIFMVGFLVIAIFFSTIKMSTTNIFLLASFTALLVAVIAFYVLKNISVRIIVLPFFKLFYTIRSHGLENIPKSGSALLLGNHITWIDWLFIQMVVKRPIKFVMHVRFYEGLGVKWLLKFFGAIPIGGSSSRSAFETISEELKNGSLVCLFPEGHMTRNSRMYDFQKGFEVAINGTNAPIIPFHMKGFWGSFWSLANKDFKKRTKKQRFRRILAISFGEMMPSGSNALEVKEAVKKQSFYSWDLYLKEQKPPHLQFLDSVRRNLFKVNIVNFDGKEVRGFAFLTAVLMFIKKLDMKGENIGILLPPSVACSALNLAIFSQKKRAVNLNYTMGDAMLEKCVNKAKIKVIFSSRKFIEKLENRGLIINENVKSRIYYLEDLADIVSKFDKISTALTAIFMPKFLINALYFDSVKLNDDALILFSSGSEGEPKGIVLTHKNLVANTKQIADLLASPKNEVMFASLPVFHTFGLTVTMLYPLVEGIKSVCVADPTDAYTVGKMACKYKATIMFGTSTFYRLYIKQRKLAPAMFDTLRYAVAGGEKLNSDVKKEFRLKFGISLLEGYGTTETGPVISVNLPNEIDEGTFKERIFERPNSVGIALAGTIVKIVDKEFNELDLGESGLILVAGHQVMKGYYESDKEWRVKIDGFTYYNTGDIGYVDERGFIFITDRLSRFAKVGGEMISLAAVEESLRDSFSEDEMIAATNLDDDKKGEKIILLYVGKKKKEELYEIVNGSSLAPIARPSEVIKVRSIPVLGTGKVDLKGLKNLAKKKLEGGIDWKFWEKD